MVYKPLSFLAPFILGLSLEEETTVILFHMEIIKIVLFIALLNSIQGCLITNCPKGGKRTLPGIYRHYRPIEMKEEAWECRRCGPNNEGRCISPSICCGPRLGCLLGTPLIQEQCSGQTPMPGTSLRYAKPCTSGVCLSDAVCCSSDGCKIDYSCELDPDFDICNLAS